jgi:two-component system, cell cycle sensor histidine kinase and response regulator CckA
MLRVCATRTLHSARALISHVGVGSLFSRCEFARSVAFIVTKNGFKVMSEREIVGGSQRRTVALGAQGKFESGSTTNGARNMLCARCEPLHAHHQQLHDGSLEFERAKHVESEATASERQRVQQPLKALIVEDSELDSELLLRALRRGGYAVSYERVETAPALIDALGRRAWDLVLSDLTMPALSALSALEIVRERCVELPFIIVSGTTGEEAAVECMRAGARDFITKSNLSRLLPAIARELHAVETRKANRQLEEQLRQAQKMEAIGRLAGGIAHDFNNLLSVIIGYTNLLVDPLKSQDPMRADLEEVRAAADRAATLTRQLLAFSRQQAQEPKILDINQVTIGMERMLRRLLAEDVELTLERAPRLGSIQADRGQIEQVIMNLIVNANDAMPDGGAMTIVTRDVELGFGDAARRSDVRPGSYVMLSVGDTGEGMDEATQARVFEPFFTTKPLNKGTGLGLSTVFGIVRESGGHIVIESEPGQGTKFEVYLPRVDAQPDAVVSTLPPPPSLAGFETVLLVEDEEQVRGVFKTILARNGYRVLEARDGAHALYVSERHEGAIDLLLTDIKMPRMSGLELAQLLSATRPAMQVLYVSGYAENSKLQSGERPGVAFLPKPVTPESLLRKIRRELDRRSALERCTGV